MQSSLPVKSGGLEIHRVLSPIFLASVVRHMALIASSKTIFMHVSGHTCCTEEILLRMCIEAPPPESVFSNAGKLFISWHIEHKLREQVEINHVSLVNK